MSLQKQLDFREQLKKELITRSEKNPKYGLRAFAKTLDMDSSHLSKILKGLRPLKIEMIETLAPKLGYNKKDITKFIEFALNKNSPEIVTDNCYHLKMDQLALISEWQHYAILEIMKHPDFQQSSEWISMHLHQPTEVIEMAIERLKRVGLLEFDKDGTWKDISKGFSTHVLGENLTSRAHRNYQAQVLDLSKESLYQVNIEKRDHSTICVASSADKIQEAKIKIKKFRRELAEFLEETENKNEIYHINIGLFPLSDGKDI